MTTRTRALTYVERRIATARPQLAAWLAADPATRDRAMRDARRAWRDYRRELGYVDRYASILTPPDTQAKLHKSTARTVGLTLLPARESGIPKVNVCPRAGQCAHVCLSKTQRNQWTTGPKLARMQFLLHNPAAMLLAAATDARREHAERLRPNMLSDIRWEFAAPEWLAVVAIAAGTPGFLSYDYTKHDITDRRPTDSYRLTYSARENHTPADIRSMAADGHTIAVVIGATPTHVRNAIAHGARILGLPTIDGLAHDDRTLDPPGHIVALAGLGPLRDPRLHAAARDHGTFLRPATWLA